MIHNNLQNHSYRYWFALIIFIATPLSGLCIDINVPSLPAVSQYFHVDKSMAQLTITSYMIGFSIFQLFAGSLVDSLGRKKPFIMAMIIFIIAVLLTTRTSNIYQMLVLRLIQGIAIGICNVSMRAAVSDLFEGKDFYKIITYGNMAWALGPILAPAIGGYLQNYFGWYAPFYFLGIYAIIVLLCNLIFLPETIVKKHPLNLKIALKNYGRMLVHKEYWVGLMCLGLMFSILTLFSIVSPFLIQNKLHYSAIQFGNMALLMGLALFLGTMTNRFLINIDFNLKMTVCFWLMLIGACVMTAIALFIPINIYNIIIPCFYLIYLVGIVFPNYYARCIALFPQMAGSANALMGSCMIFIPSGISVIGAFLKSDTQLPFALTYLGIIVVCLILNYWSLIGKKTDV